MGIRDLLTLLRPVSIDRHISEYHGCKVVIDGSGWIHRSAAQCAFDVVHEFLPKPKLASKLTPHVEKNDSTEFTGLGKRKENPNHSKSHNEKSDILLTQEISNAKKKTKYTMKITEKQFDHPLIAHFLSLCELLQTHGLDFVLVFDGQYLAAKSNEAGKRKQSRQTALKEGYRYLNAGDKIRAEQYFRKAITVTTRMKYLIIETVRRKGYKFIVAPYEADSQLAYFCKTQDRARGITLNPGEMKQIKQVSENIYGVLPPVDWKADAVISEDSDCLVYGCPKLLCKLTVDGNCVEICQKYVRSLGPQSQRPSPQIVFSHFNQADFLAFCILLGCDTCSRIPSIGKIKAFHLIQKRIEKKNIDILTTTDQRQNREQDISIEETNESTNKESNEDINKRSKEDKLDSMSCPFILKKFPGLFVDPIPLINEAKLHLSGSQRKLGIPKDYLKNFTVAALLFRFATVYDLESRKLVPLWGNEESYVKELVGYEDVLGKRLLTSDTVLQQLVTGNLNPKTLEPWEFV
eukprot:g842.t1